METGKKFRYGVYIGRFQPLHTAHLDVIKSALNQVEELILFIGSANAAPDTKNPFSASERIEMIKAAVADEIGDAKIHYLPIRDYFYNENIWIAEVQRGVYNIIDPYEDSIALFGAYKDESSYYITLFPQWTFIPTEASLLSSTIIRNGMFSDLNNVEWQNNIPKSIYGWLKKNFIYDVDGATQSERYLKFKKEFEYITEYRRTHSKTGNFPSTMTTVDAVVIKSGHVLLIKRKGNPGKGLYALPGGFIEQNELLKSAVLRELKEETNLKVNKSILERCIRSTKVFDYPSRSLRGRLITHAFHIDLGDHELPEGPGLWNVKGSDDAAKAMWVPIDRALAMDTQFFEDHWHILHYFFVQARI